MYVHLTGFSCIEPFLHFRKKSTWSWCKSFWCIVEISLLVTLDHLLVILICSFFSTVFVWIYFHSDKDLTLSFDLEVSFHFLKEFEKVWYFFKFCNSFSIFAYLFKNLAVSFIDVFLFYISLISGLIFINSFLSLFWV